jgi:cbb3-type cytochrome oxidase maturation protein
MSLGGLILLSLALGLLAWLAFLWTVKTGQYDDPEGAKYRMLEEDDGEPRPRAPPGGTPGAARPAAGPGRPDEPSR